MFSVYKEPKVIHNFLTNEQCEYLINDTSGEFTPTKFTSTVDTNQGIRSMSKRVSKSIDVLKSICKKCTRVVDLPIENFEDFLLIKYEKGGFTGKHQDGGTGGNTNRLYTFLFALNDDYEGGETKFEFLNKMYKLKKGDALFFHNFNNDGSSTKLSVHEGCIVKSGQKFICNTWIRNVIT